MKKIKEISFINKILIGMILLTIILSITLLFVTGNNNGEVKSLILGSIIAMLLNFWHFKLTISISENDYTKLKKFTILSFVVRYLIYAAIILIGWLLSDFHPIYIVFGIGLYPLTSLIVSFTTMKGE